MGQVGRVRATRRAVVPLVVLQTMAAQFSALAVSAAA